MSRSHKKQPWITQDSTKGAKRAASKKVRRSNKVGDGGAYKKLYCSWNICDFKVYCGKLHDDWQEKALRK